MASALYDNLTGEKSIGAGAKVKEEREGMLIGEVVGAENVVKCMEEIGSNLD